MRKNNWFMHAYIIFLFVCIFVHCVVQFPLWSPLVTAVTASSWIFAIADIALFYSDISTEVFERYKKQRMRFMLAINKEVNAVEEYESTLNQTDSANDPEHEGIVRAKETSLDLKKAVTEIEQAMASRHRKAQVAEKVGAALYIIGFVTLLSTVVFAPLNIRLGRIQDTLTVSAFALVLSTQYSREKIIQTQKGLLEEVDNLLLDYETGSEKVQYYCQKKRHETSLEAENNAD